MAGLRHRLRCPNCGVRAIEEFVYGEIPTPSAGADLDAEALDLDRGFMHWNVEGEVVERWFHADGCRRWLTVARDTRTNETSPD